MKKERNFIRTIVLFVLFSGFILTLNDNQTLFSKISSKEKSLDRKPKVKTELLVFFMNYPYEIWSNDPTKIHLTLFKPDFKPAVDAKVTVNGKSVGTADKNGVCIFDYEPGSGQSHHMKATLTEKGKSYAIEYDFACNARTVSFKQDKLYVYTDRGVYNPGQDMLIRLIAWEMKGEYSALPEARVQLLFQDKKGKVYSGDYVKTDEFGIASAKFSLPKNMPEGDYELVVLYEQARETASIRVERFVPPIISIKHDLKRYFTDTQKKLETECTLGYFTGGEMKSSQLTLSILTYDKKEIFNKNFSSADPVYHIALDEKDLASFKDKLVLETPFKIKLLAKDNRGQKDEVTWDLTYTARPFSAVLELDKDAYQKGETVQILAKVVDLDSQPAKEIPLMFEASEISLKKDVKTDVKGVAVLEFSMPGKPVTVILKSPLMKDVLQTISVPYQEPKPMASKVSEPPKGSGMKTRIIVNFDPDYVPVEKVVHLDMTDDSGSLVVSTTIPVSEGKAYYQASGEVTSPTWGTMLVNLYCCAVQKKNAGKPYSVNTVGFITEGQHVTFYPDKELEITVENFKPQVKPGEIVEFKIRVKGGSGEKALGVSLVDDAVLSLMNPFIKNPVTHFYNPQGKTISTGGAGVLTWPVVDRSWGSPWRDIAYCNWGWKEPGSYSVGSRIGENNGSSGTSKPGDVDDEEKIYESSSQAYGATELKTVPKKKSMDSPSLSMVANGNAGPAEDEDTKNRRTSGTEKKSMMQIVIRKEFPETAFWAPLLVTGNNEADITVKMPDSMTIQKLSILATDKKGYIGLSQKEIKVTQPLFIRSVFPACMTYQDRIKVHALVQNATEKKIMAKATLVSEDLKVLGPKENVVEIKPFDAVLVAWEISADRCGTGRYTVSVETEGFKDSEEKSIFVSPAGEPMENLVQGSAKDDLPFSAKFKLDPKSTYRTVFVNISLPNVFPAFQAWWAFEDSPFYSPWQVAAHAIMNAAMLEYLHKTQGDKEKIALINKRLNEAAAQLALQQFPSGAWGWYFLPDATSPDSRPFVGGENLYYTVYVVRALLEMKEADVKVEDSIIKKALDFIMKNRDKNGLWSSKGAYFWEVFNAETDHALSAEIFEVLCRSLLLVPQAKEYEKDLSDIKDKVQEALKKDQDEPMTVASAVQGLIYWAQYRKDEDLKRSVSGMIDSLIRLKRTGHWEPHWYHAYGGMVELNAKILELLAEYDMKKFESYVREGVTWLLSTREAWGAWHNEVGTANAIRALLKTGVFTDEKECTLILKVNGVEKARVLIDPKDPFLSAAKLRYLEITDWVKDNENSIEVDYDGNLTASVMLNIDQWGLEQPKAENLIKIDRVLSAKANLGEVLSVNLRLRTDKELSMIVLEDSILANTEVDMTSLDQLKKEKKIMDYQIEKSKLYLTLEKVQGQLDLVYKLKAVYQGKALHAGLITRDMSRGVVLAHVISGPLEVK